MKSVFSKITKHGYLKLIQFSLSLTQEAAPVLAADRSEGDAGVSGKGLIIADAPVLCQEETTLQSRIFS